MDAVNPSRAFEVTHARVLSIAGPMTLANMTTPLLGVIGTAVIGQLGQAHLLGAVAISAVVFDCVFWLFGFLRMGTVALTAQALGAGDAVEQRAVLARALLMAYVLGALIVALQWPIAEAAYRLMGASAEVTEAAKVYFYVRVWSAPFTLANYAVLGWLIGRARTGLALGLQIAINLVNLGTTFLLVLVFGLGVAGAALGSLAAEAVGLATGLVLARQLGRRLAPLPRLAVLDREKFVRMVVVNRDIMIRTAALIVAFGFFTAQSARSGDTILAANAVLNNLVLVAAYFLDGFATAAEQLCGRAVGARDPRAFRKAVRLSISWGFVLAVVVAAAFAFLGGHLVALMTASPEVREAAHKFLLFAILAPIAGVFAYAFDGIFIGATWTRDMRNLMLASLALYFVAWWSFTGFGNAGYGARFSCSSPRAAACRRCASRRCCARPSLEHRVVIPEAAHNATLQSRPAEAGGPVTAYAHRSRQRRFTGSPA
jgi:MATE family multidrug resistance protein